MPQLVKKVEGYLGPNISDYVVLLTALSAQIQQEDYVNTNAFVAYLQNLKQTNKTSLLTKPLNFGLKNKNNLPIVTLNIDY